MTTDVKLLPLPAFLPLSAAGARQTLEDYARANMAELLAENERLRGDLDLAEIKDFLRRAAPFARAIVRAQTETEEREACRALAKLYNDDLDALLSREEG